MMRHENLNSPGDEVTGTANMIVLLPIFIAEGSDEFWLEVCENKDDFFFQFEFRDTLISAVDPRLRILF